MSKYITLFSWTEQGVQNFKDTVARADAAKKLASEMGGSFEIYWTLGEYDIVSISEFPDDETATAFLLGVASQGNIRSKTMRAFDSGEMQGIIAKG
ncbi:MAG TPA: GYD domain-containing protein [Actinomycetota bacterium]|nr:GYD domain-containing protein [Actinomycetota bacterium]